MITLALVAIVATACAPNERILQSANENTSGASESAAMNSNIASSVSSFDQDLNAMRTADFNFIYVLRRKDGATLRGDDKSFLSRTIPSEMNRRQVSDEGRAVIIGSNFRLSPELVKVFRDRFALEDHSKPGAEPSGGG